MIRAMLQRLTFVCLLPLLLLIACGGEPESAPDASPEGEAASSADAPPPLPEGIGPIASTGEKPQAPVDLGEPITGAGITYQIPEGWTRTTPTSSMRMDQATIPGEGGDGELTIFFFGVGGGGGVEANLQRWAGQMELTAPPERDVFTLENGLRVTWLDATGTLKASTMGTGPTTDQAGSRLLAAVVEGPGGPWFFKATGPEATLSSQRDAFRALLHSLRPTAPTA
jgi:hypothetical protein